MDASWAMADSCLVLVRHKMDRFPSFPACPGLMIDVAQVDMVFGLDKTLQDCQSNYTVNVHEAGVIAIAGRSWKAIDQ